MGPVDQALVVGDLTKSYGSVSAVDGVSFSVPAGSIFGLLGRNGAGKTTTLECIIGLRQADSGSVFVEGVDALAHPNRVKDLIGVQLQSIALQEQITPREALKLFGSFYRKAADVDSLIERFLLDEKADARFETLSDGQRQRLALALALANQPRILFLDEPTAGLDPAARRQLHTFIRELRSEGRTVILTTHYIEEAHELCDRIGIIHRGRLVANAPPAELIASARAKTLEDAFIALTTDAG